MFPNRRYPNVVSPTHRMSDRLQNWSWTLLSSSLPPGQLQIHPIAKLDDVMDMEDAVAPQAIVDVESKAVDNRYNHIANASALWTVAFGLESGAIAGVECCRHSARHCSVGLALSSMDVWKRMTFHANLQPRTGSELAQQNYTLGTVVALVFPEDYEVGMAMVADLERKGLGDLENCYPDTNGESEWKVYGSKPIEWMVVEEPLQMALEGTVVLARRRLKPHVLTVVTWYSEVAVLPCHLRTTSASLAGIYSH